jgi:hypothetical protein
MSRRVRRRSFAFFANSYLPLWFTQRRELAYFTPLSLIQRLRHYTKPGLHLRVAGLPCEGGVPDEAASPSHYLCTPRL